MEREWGKGVRALYSPHPLSSPPHPHPLGDNGEGQGLRYFEGYALYSVTVMGLRLTSLSAYASHYKEETEKGRGG